MIRENKIGVITEYKKNIGLEKQRYVEGIDEKKTKM